MRAFLLFVLGCVSLRADFSYESRVQVNGGSPIVTTRSIKGRKMAILTRKHTSVIDLDAETITAIDYNKKTYSVVPFAKWKKAIDDAAAKGTHETSFKVTIHTGASPASTKPMGILNATESTIDIAGASGALKIAVDAWVGVVPGYEQMRDFIDKLAEKLGYSFAAGLAEPVLAMPESMQGFDQAIKETNKLAGAQIETRIKITTAEKTVAQALIQLSKFAGGAQLAAIFVPPDGFKKVEASAP